MSATQPEHPMKHRSIAVLFSIVASVAFASRPAVSVRTALPVAPLDRSPIPAYPAAPRGPARTVSGQCFVVTDGGQKVRLAQVEVCIYPQREFEWYAQEVGARCQARFERMKAIAFPKNFAALSVPAMDRSIAAAEALRREIHGAWQVLPAAEASARTDANGRFSITHRVALPYIVFAVGSRTFGGETEYYQWQVSSSVIPDPAQVELSNDNLR